jgi:GNAT superfamily N-acetyltransferase
MSALPRPASADPRPPPLPPGAVQIHLAGPRLYPACLTLDDSYTSARMWQVMPRALDDAPGPTLAPADADGPFGVTLGPVRLPRAVHEPGLAQTQPPAARLAGWEAADCFLVATPTESIAPLPDPQSAIRAPQSDEVWGFIVLNALAASGIGWISELAVAPALRERGLGRQLLDAARAWALAPADQGGAGGLRALGVRLAPRNYPAIRFCRRAGFRFAGFTDYTPAGGDLRLVFLAPLE